jgi:hypothetical protein
MRSRGLGQSGVQSWDRWNCRRKGGETEKLSRLGKVIALVAWLVACKKEGVFSSSGLDAEAIALDALAVPDAAAPDVAVPDMTAAPDVARTPDMAVTPDAAVAPDAPIEPDTARTPDAPVVSDVGPDIRLVTVGDVRPVSMPICDRLDNVAWVYYWVSERCPLKKGAECRVPECLRSGAYVDVSCWAGAGEGLPCLFPGARPPDGGETGVGVYVRVAVCEECPQ